MVNTIVMMACGQPAGSVSPLNMHGFTFALAGTVSAAVCWPLSKRFASRSVVLCLRTVDMFCGPQSFDLEIFI
jgi:hypothetical protein